eukprot:344508_1
MRICFGWLVVCIVIVHADILKCHKDGKCQESNILDETQHILRNYGRNVCTIDSGCHFSKGAISHGNIFQNLYNVETYVYVSHPQIMQINLDRAYVLNTFKYWLYDKDNRVYKYKIEVSSDGKSWSTIADHENKESWQTLQFEEQFIKYIRFVGGKNSVNNYLHICKFYAFYDYSINHV